MFFNLADVSPDSHILDKLILIADLINVVLGSRWKCKVVMDEDTMTELKIIWQRQRCIVVSHLSPLSPPEKV